MGMWKEKRGANDQKALLFSFQPIPPPPGVSVKVLNMKSF